MRPHFHGCIHLDVAPCGTMLSILDSCYLHRTHRSSSTSNCCFFCMDLADCAHRVHHLDCCVWEVGWFPSMLLPLLAEVLWVVEGLLLVTSLPKIVATSTATSISAIPSASSTSSFASSSSITTLLLSPSIYCGVCRWNIW